MLASVDDDNDVILGVFGGLSSVNVERERMVQSDLVIQMTFHCTATTRATTTTGLE